MRDVTMLAAGIVGITLLWMGHHDAVDEAASKPILPVVVEPTPQPEEENCDTAAVAEVDSRPVAHLLTDGHCLPCEVFLSQAAADPEYPVQLRRVVVRVPPVKGASYPTIHVKVGDQWWYVWGKDAESFKAWYASQGDGQ